MVSCTMVRFAMVLLTLPAFRRDAQPSNELQPTVRFVTTGSTQDAWVRGAQMGVEEAAHTAALVGAAAPELVMDSVTGNATAYVGGTDAASCARGMSSAKATGALFMALACPDSSTG